MLLYVYTVHVIYIYIHIHTTGYFYSILVTVVGTTTWDEGGGDTYSEDDERVGAEEDKDQDEACDSQLLGFGHSVGLALGNALQQDARKRNKLCVCLNVHSKVLGMCV